LGFGEHENIANSYKIGMPDLGNTSSIQAMLEDKVYRNCEENNYDSSIFFNIVLTNLFFMNSEYYLNIIKFKTQSLYMRILLE
jgi:hypothetical protein